jgi:hypothetical protein
MHERRQRLGEATRRANTTDVLATGRSGPCVWLRCSRGPSPACPRAVRSSRRRGVLCRRHHRRCVAPEPSPRCVSHARRGQPDPRCVDRHETAAGCRPGEGVRTVGGRARGDHATCLDLGDGRLDSHPLGAWQRPAVIDQFQPDVVVTFGPDGGRVILITSPVWRDQGAQRPTHRDYCTRASRCAARSSSTRSSTG